MGQFLKNATVVRSTPFRNKRPATVARIELENGFSFELAESSLPIVIGRSKECGITLPSGHVSRRHCELYLVNGALCLKDMSRNGTRVDGRMIKETSVFIQKPTTLILAGDVKITVRPEGQTTIRHQERAKEERREAERRGADRRQNSVVVNFERRVEERRSGVDRRACSER